MNPKILVGTVTCDKYEYCLKEFLDAVKDLSYDNFDIHIVDNSKDKKYVEKLKTLHKDVTYLPHKEELREMLIEGHNFLREKAVKEKYDYLFLVDQDIILPFNILKRLLEHKKKVITGLYYNVFNPKKDPHQNVLLPVLYREGSDKNKVIQYSVEEVRDPRLLDVRQCGTGALLLDKEILEKIPFRYEKGSENYDDTWFCSDIIKAKYKIFCDTAMKCKHRVLDKTVDEKTWAAKS
ncbi:MAG: glycosyltransferase [Candidatus Woesearchaeota archaeon]|jgi:GT2 family glycosyltransferase|nr:glycosyltransferase [Candidatus Woesearchaeota archaeon]